MLWWAMQYRIRPELAPADAGSARAGLHAVKPLLARHA